MTPTTYLQHSGCGEDDLILAPSPGRFREWRVARDWCFRAYDMEFTIPIGALSDLSSIPRAFWSLISPFDLSIKAPIVHDYLYSLGGRRPADRGVRYGQPGELYVSRREADRLFMEIMREEGVPYWRALLGWAAVRTFAIFAWWGHVRRLARMEQVEEALGGQQHEVAW